RIEETIAGIVLHLRKLHEQGVVLSDLLLRSRQSRPIHIAKIVATKIQARRAAEPLSKTMFNPRLGANAEQFDGGLCLSRHTKKPAVRIDTGLLFAAGEQGLGEGSALGEEIRQAQSHLPPLLD